MSTKKPGQAPDAKGPNITRVIHSITIQAVELDGNALNPQIMMLNPQNVPISIAHQMLSRSADVALIMLQAQRKGGGDA